MQQNTGCDDTINVTNIFTVYLEYNVQRETNTHTLCLFHSTEGIDRQIHFKSVFHNKWFPLIINRLCMLHAPFLYILIIAFNKVLV